MKSRWVAFFLIVLGWYLLVSPGGRTAAQTDPRGVRIQPKQQGERRVALVIGNSAYKDSPLLNPVNDARAMAQSLRGHGFDVLYGENLSQNDMKRNIEAFGDRIRNGGIGLFYYAGHGIQIKGSNYLIPVNAAITRETEVEYESVDLGRVLEQMETARNRLNIVILDACRNNPFARGFRSAQKGLASIEAPSGTLIAYATAPGSVASDGAQGNGLYTKQLLKFMQVPGLSIEQVFKQVRVAVRGQTEGKQTPWESSSLEGEFYFSVSAIASTTTKDSPPSAVDPAAVELSFWESIRNSENPEDFKAYLRKYPSGTFASLAQARAYPDNRPTLPRRDPQTDETFSGTRLRLTLTSPISTSNARVGDSFEARVSASIRNVDGKDVWVGRIRKTTDQDETVDGHVSLLNRSGRVSGKTELGLVFDSWRLRDGKTIRIKGELVAVYASENVKSVDKEGRLESARLTVGAASGVARVFLEGNKDLILDVGAVIEILVTSENR